MKVVGLTGSIGMGKSTAAGFFRARGVPVHDADGVVHRLYAGRAAPLVEAAFPGTVADGAVDRAALGRRVLGDAEALATLEAIVHPLVREAERDFLAHAASSGAGLAVLDVPLLFETGRAQDCDIVCVVSAPAAIQRARVLARPGMSEEKLASLLARQTPDEDKRRWAHVVIDSARGLENGRRQADDILRAFAGR